MCDVKFRQIEGNCRLFSHIQLSITVNFSKSAEGDLGGGGVGVICKKEVILKCFSPARPGFASQPGAFAQVGLRGRQIVVNTFK